MYTPVIDFEHFCCLALDIVKSGLQQLILSIFAAWHQIWSKVPCGSRFLSFFHDWPQKWSKVTSGNRFSAFSLLSPRNGEKYFPGNDSDNLFAAWPVQHGVWKDRIYYNSFARLPVFPFARLPVCPFARLPVLLFARLPVCPFGCLAVWPFGRSSQTLYGSRHDPSPFTYIQLRSTGYQFSSNRY